MRRFWKVADAVAAEGGWAIRLDGRPVRTPARATLIVPGEALAGAIAAEWDRQGDVIDPGAMPMTGFANATLDRVLPALGDFRGQIAAYAQSDLFCYRADGPASLVERQRDQWEPLLEWARTCHAIDFVVTTGILPVEQPARTLAVLRGAVEALDPWLLAGVATITQIGGSLVGALALLEAATTAEALFAITTLDERWQAEQWGEDEAAAAQMMIRRATFLDAAGYCGLVRAV